MDVDTKTEKSVISHSRGYRSVSFSPNSRTLASTEHSNSEVHLWDVNTGKQIGELTGHTNGVTSISFSPDRDSRILASGGNDAVSLWNVDSRKEITALHILGVSIVLVSVQMAKRLPAAPIERCV